MNNILSANHPLTKQPNFCKKIIGRADGLTRFRLAEAPDKQIVANHIGWNLYFGNVTCLVRSDFRHFCMESYVWLRLYCNAISCFVRHNRDRRLYFCFRPLPCLVLHQVSFSSFSFFIFNFHLLFLFFYISFAMLKVHFVA